MWRKTCQPLILLLALVMFGTTVEAADDDYGVLPSFPAIMALGQDVLLDEVQRRRNQKIKQLFEESGMTQEELGQAIGMDQSQLSKQLRGILPWREKWLARLAEIWNMPLLELLSLQPEELPVCTLVMAKGEFPYACVAQPEEGLGTVPAILDLGLNGPGHLYVLRVADDSLAAYCPTLKAGVLLYVEKQGGARLRDGQLGVEVHGNGMGRLMVVSLNDGLNQVILKSIHPDGPVRVHPRAYLQRLDRVAYLKL